eukprot:13092910-Alexandrium_andersonii.AAC.1
MCIRDRSSRVCLAADAFAKTVPRGGNRGEHRRALVGTRRGCCFCFGGPCGGALSGTLCKDPCVLRLVALCPPALPGGWPGGRWPSN